MSCSTYSIITNSCLYYLCHISIFYVCIIIVGSKRERDWWHEYFYGVDWNGSILGPQGTLFDSRLFELSIHCGSEYPDKPPQVRFCSRINLPHVNKDTGEVERTLPAIQSWSRSNTIESVLVGLRNTMTTTTCRGN